MVGRYVLGHGVFDDLTEIVGERVNGAKLPANGEITAREYEAGLTEGHSLDWKTFGEMFQPAVRGTTLYLIVTFSACGFVYYGFSFIYPHTLKQVYPYMY